MTRSTAPGSPPSDETLLTAPEFVMRRRTRLLGPGPQEFLGRHDAPLATMVDSSLRWPSGNATWLLVSSRGETLAGIEQRRRGGDREFLVRSPGGNELGRLVQTGGVVREGRILNLGLAILCDDGRTAELAGGGLTGRRTRTLTGPTGQALGELAVVPAGLGGRFTGSTAYRVRLSPEVTGQLRLLAAVAAAALDLILND